MKLARPALLVSVLIVVGLLLAIVGTATASASCGSRPTLSPSKSKVRKGSRVRLKGTTCPGSAIVVQTKKSGTWRVIAGQTPASGSFAACTKPRPPLGKAYAKFRARGSSLTSRVVSVKVSQTSGSTTGCASAATTSTRPAPTKCAFSGLQASGCNTIAADTAGSSNPLSLWGAIDCADPSRASWSASGGDNHVTGTGAAQGNTAYRSLNVIDGDNFYGERCELGHNEWRGGGYGSTFALYREGQHRDTFMSFRLPANFPLGQVAPHPYDVVMQMKQTQPSNAGGGSPMIELDAYGGRWHLLEGSDSQEIWSAPAQTGAWTRFSFDVVYSQNPSVGSITVHSDLNGDGDSADAGEESSTVHGATLKVETAGTDYGIAAGQSIPSHLRTGIYHDVGTNGYSCPAPSGCSVDVDNVQVLG